MHTLLFALLLAFSLLTTTLILREVRWTSFLQDPGSPGGLLARVVVGLWVWSGLLRLFMGMPGLWLPLGGP